MARAIAAARDTDLVWGAFAGSRIAAIDRGAGHGSSAAAAARRTAGALRWRNGPGPPQA